MGKPSNLKVAPNPQWGYKPLDQESLITALNSATLGVFKYKPALDFRFMVFEVFLHHLHRASGKIETRNDQLIPVQ